MSYVNMATNIFGQVASATFSGELSPGQVWGKVNEQVKEQVLETRRQGLTPIKGDSTDKVRNVEYVKQLIRAEERAGIPANRIMLVGFSQGACQAISCALQMQIRLAGVVALSTWFPQGEESSQVSATSQGLPIYMSHGDDDWVVPVELGRKAEEQCRKMGLDVRYVEYAGLGHDISLDVLRGVRRFVQEQVPRVAPANVSVWKELEADVTSADINII